MEQAGGWTWRARALGPVHGLGFSDADLDRELASFSGGELTRASLARTLSGDPDLLLLDEPTNHLDIASLEWLEGYLQTVDAAGVLLAPHPRVLRAGRPPGGGGGGRPPPLFPRPGGPPGAR